jgi:hypothetical protein
MALNRKMKHLSSIETFRTAHLLRKLLLTQLVECEKLPGQNNVVNESTTGQFHPYDNLTVRDHHGHRAEVNLQVFWEFLPPCIARILNRKKNPKMNDMFLGQQGHIGMILKDSLCVHHKPGITTGELIYISHFYLARPSHELLIGALFNTKVFQTGMEITIPISIDGTWVTHDH